jgi:ribonuclease HI
MTDRLKEVSIYTDGACLGNPGAGGYGVVLLYGEHRKELSGGFRLTTNNRMEIMAVIIGLTALKTKCTVTVYSDSQYVINSITKGWAKGWQAKGWRKKDGSKAVNPDLWAELLDLCSQHQVEFRWVRGHSGNVENERCDRLAVAAAQQQNLPIDIEYEKSA